VVHDAASTADLLFLERWEINPEPGTAAALRIAQLRRANPALAAEIRAEIAARRSGQRIRIMLAGGMLAPAAPTVTVTVSGGS
jgi:hypothetical protein